MKLRRPLAGLRAASLLLLLASPLSDNAHALLLVNGDVQAVGFGVWRYDFTVSNTGPDDVLLVTLTDAPVGDPLIGPSLSAPTGFTASYDSNAILSIAFVDLLEDTQLFAAGTSVGLFSFQSQASPGSAFNAFEAFEADFDLVTGQTVLTVIDGAVPLPGTLWLALSALSMIQFRRPSRHPIPR